MNEKNIVAQETMENVVRFAYVSTRTHRHRLNDDVAAARWGARATLAKTNFFGTR
jgi:hypothetical protein